MFTLLSYKLKRHLPAFVTGLLVLFAWEAVVRGFSISKWLLPSPSRVFLSMFSDRALLVGHSVRTLQEAIVGLTLATVAGLVLGGLVFSFRALRRTLYPFLVISQTIPIIVLIPLLIMWLGFGMTPKLVIVALACFFPVAVNTVDGLSAADREKVDLLRSMGANSWQTFRLVQVPSALPQILSGIRIGATYAIMAAVVAEWMGSDKGLGVFIVRASNSFRTDRVFAGIVLVSFFSILLFQSVNLLQRWLTPWAIEES